MTEANENLFTLDDKLQALEVLKENNYSYDVAAKKVGVKISSLRDWARDLMPMVDSEASAVVDVMNATDEDLDIQYDRTVREIRTLMLQRMRDIVATESDLDKITRTLKLLHDISSGGVWSGNKDRGQKNWFTQVNQAIYNIQGKTALKEMNNGN